jgi:hypothetical protein
VLSSSFSFFGKQFPLTVLSALILFTPLALFQLHLADKIWAGEIGFDWRKYGSSRTWFWDALEHASGTITTVLGFMLPVILQAVLTFGVFQFLRGHEVEPVRSVREGLSRILPVLGVALLTGLLILVVIVVIVLLLQVGAIPALFLGILLIVIVCVFYVAVQVAVVEHLSPIRAMARSAWLTRGARWKIFGILLLIGIGNGIANTILQTVVGGDLSSFGRVQVAIIATMALTALFGAFQAVAAAVVYHDLRRAKEGVNVEDLLEVFD